MPLPKPPPRRRIPGFSPGRRAATSTPERLRGMVREHEEEERPFDPERRGSWHGSSRELVVNGPPRDGWWDPAADIGLCFKGGTPVRIWVGDEGFLGRAKPVSDVLEQYGVTLLGDRWETVDDGWERDVGTPAASTKLVLNPDQFHRDLRELVDASKLAEPDEAFEKAKEILEEGGNPNAVMNELNELLDMHGVEAYPSQQLPRPSYLYLASGDTYNSTLVYSYAENKYFVATAGDIIEAEEPNLLDEAWSGWIRDEVEKCVRRDIEHNIDLTEVQQDELLGRLDDFDDDELRRIFEESVRDVKNAEIVHESDGSVFVHRMKEVCSEASDRVVTQLQAMAPNARRSNGGAMTAEEFMAAVKAEADVRGRELHMSFSPRSGQLFINYYNLPEEIVARKEGGDAEAENNRFMFVVDGFSTGSVRFGKGVPGPTSKVKLEHSINSGNRAYRLRGKTGAPDAVARYLAAFLTKVAAEVPPKYTHSREPNARRRRKTVFRVRGTADDHRDQYMRFGYSGRTLTEDHGGRAPAIARAEKFMREQPPVGREAVVWVEESEADGTMHRIGRWSGKWDSAARKNVWVNDYLYEK